ncbi:hypothetical protein KAT08_03605 [Candidatus Babeliales bacterium]|nr:hypothetical protein [Candidatus Babeliales bacterium]
MKKFNLILFFVIVFISYELHLETKDENFIISKNKKTKKLSKNRLKEKIGENVKKLLYNFVELNKRVGKLQQEVSEIEKHMFEKAEQLVDNKKPFKKAGKNDLADALKIMLDVNSELLVQLNSLTKIREKINKNDCLKKTTG